MRLPSGTSMTLTGPSLTPSRLSVVLLDLGLWLEFLELGFYDSLLGDCNQEGKQIQYKLIKSCESSAFKDPGQCVFSCCIELFECFERLDEMTDGSNDKNGIEIALGFLENLVQILENSTV